MRNEFSLDRLDRPNASTREAAAYLGVGTGCLRKWHSRGNGPLQAIKIGKNLYWPIKELRRVAGQVK